jgi:hypothetical protein
MRLTWVMVTIAIALTTSGCGIKEFTADTDQKFGDQHFKTAITLIETHKVRFGSYPESLKDLALTGDWDAIALANVEYRKLGTGYELNLTGGWIGKPELSYPPGFLERPWDR